MKIEYWIIGGLGLVIAALILFDKDPVPDYSEHEQRINRREQAIHDLQRENTVLRAKIDSDSVKHASDIIASRVQINFQSSLIRDLKEKPEVVQIIQSSPQIDSLVRAYENVIVEYIVRDSLNLKYIDDLRVDLRAVESNFEERLKLMGENVADLKAITEDQRKQLRNIRRSNRLLKVVTVVGAVASFLAGSQL